MTPISKYIADLYASTEMIMVYGNFALYKKSLSLPQYLVNQMTKEELVLFIARDGVWKDQGEINGYSVSEVQIGTGRMLVASKEDEIRFIIGV